LRLERMLKINLLPPYINQQSKIRSAWTLMGVLLAVELVGLTLFQASKRAEEDQKIAEVTQKETQVGEVQKLATEAQQIRSEVAPIKEKTDFINQLLSYNKVRPDLYERVASYIYREIWVSGMQAEQNILTMPASGKSISGVGRFLLFMQNSPDFSRIQISSVPGWPPGTPGVEAGGLSGDAGGGLPGGPGFGPPGGGYGGPPGGATTGAVPGGPPSGPGYGPPGGGAPGYGTGGGASPGYGGTDSPAGGPPIFGGAAPGGGGPNVLAPPSSLGPGDTGITTGGAPIPYLPPEEQVRPRPNYFAFTVTGVLTKPIIRPSYGGVGVEGDTGGGSPYGGYGGPGSPYGPPGGPGGPMGSGPVGSGPVGSGPVGSGG
jgi:hypothetical protein